MSIISNVLRWCKENNIFGASYYYYLKWLRQQAISNVPVAVEKECLITFKKKEVFKNILQSELGINQIHED